MSYVDQNLMGGEDVVYRTYLHPIVFLRPAVFLVVGVWLLGSETPSLGFLAFLGFIVSGINAAVTYTTSEFSVTSMRIVMKSGFIRRHTVEIFLNKVESIQVDQSVLGRGLDYGSVIVSGTGGTPNRFDRIRSPLEFRKKSQEQIVIAQGIRGS